MPADARVLLAYLNMIQITNTRNAPTDPGWLANDVAKGVSYLMETTYLQPRQQAALFEMMARIPGFTVVRGIRDAVGRLGVGVEWSFLGNKAGAVILNPRTYAILGVRTWPAPDFHGPGAEDYDGDALVKIAIVDKAGQMP
jgi:hypothetical protein